MIAGAALFGRQAVSALPAFSEWVKSLGAWGPAVFIGGYAIAAVLLMPCFLLTLSAGALWGLRAGVLYVMLGASLGAIIAFLCARYLVRGFVAGATSIATRDWPPSIARSKAKDCVSSSSSACRPSSRTSC